MIFKKRRASSLLIKSLKKLNFLSQLLKIPNSKPKIALKKIGMWMETNNWESKLIESETNQKSLFKKSL